MGTGGCPGQERGDVVSPGQPDLVIAYTERGTTRPTPPAGLMRPGGLVLSPPADQGSETGSAVQVYTTSRRRIVTGA